MAEIKIKTRFGTLNLGSGTGGGVPLALQIAKDPDTEITKPIAPTDSEIISDLVLKDDFKKKPDGSYELNEQGEKIPIQTLIKKAVSLVDIVKPLTDNNEKPLINSIKLEEANDINKLMLNTVDLSALPQLEQQESWLILDSEKALINDKPKSFADTDKTGMNNLENK